MNTFKHNRTHNGILATALAASAFGLALVSPGALAMTSEHDTGLGARADGRAAVILDARGARVVANPNHEGDKTRVAEQYIGGPVGNLPRPDAAR